MLKLGFSEELSKESISKHPTDKGKAIAYAATKKKELGLSMN